MLMKSRKRNTKKYSKKKINSKKRKIKIKKGGGQPAAAAAEHADGFAGGWPGCWVSAGEADDVAEPDGDSDEGA